MDPDQLQRILETVVKAAADNARRDRTEDNAAIIAAAMEAAQSGQQKSRKPNLPPFDPKNIDTWIRRMNAAFDRLEITNPKLKFSHVDEKIQCDSDPIINEFMCGAPTQVKWDEFVEYLRDKHGKTTQQRADAIIAGTERENRTPSQLWAIMMDKAGKATLDDVHKQQLLKRLPQEVRQHLEGKIEGKTGKEVATLADVYFDKQGKLKNQTGTSNINAVRPPHQQPQPQPQPILRAPDSSTRSSEPPLTYTSAFTSGEESPDISAVRFKQGQKQRFNVENQQGGRSQSRGRSFSRGNNDNSNSHQSNNRYSNNGGRFGGSSSSNHNNNKKVCHFHNKFGDKAERCEEFCMMWSTHSAAKGQASR